MVALSTYFYFDMELMIGICIFLLELEFLGVIGIGIIGV